MQISRGYATVISLENWKHLPDIPSDDICCVSQITAVTNTVLFPAEKMSLFPCFSLLLSLPFVSLCSAVTTLSHFNILVVRRVGGSANSS